jgi:hypothetical protein
LTTYKAKASHVGLAYVYCDYRDHTQQTLVKIIGAITKQLLRQLDNPPNDFEDLWQKSHEGKVPLEERGAMEALSSVCRSFERTYICIDALDECHNASGLLNLIYQAPSNTRTFATTREHVLVAVRKYFESSQRIEIEAKLSDIRILVEQRIEADRHENPDLMTTELQIEITEKICQLSKGMYV